MSAFTIRDLLHDAADRLGEAGVEGGRLDARILLARAMLMSREQLIAADRRPSAEEASAYRAMIDRRVAREPLAYEPAVLAFLNGDTVMRWAEVTLGL